MRRALCGIDARRGIRVGRGELGVRSRDAAW